MTPTLLEAVVVLLLFWVAWQIGVAVAPRVIASFLAFWRGNRPPADFRPRNSEKNITPPADAGENTPRNYGSSRK